MPSAQVEAQRKRLEKEIEQLEKVIANSERQLANEEFLAARRRRWLNSIRQKLAEYGAQFDKSRAALAELPHHEFDVLPSRNPDAVGARWPRTSGPGDITSQACVPAERKPSAASSRASRWWWPESSCCR